MPFYRYPERIANAAPGPAVRSLTTHDCRPGKISLPRFYSALLRHIDSAGGITMQTKFRLSVRWLCFAVLLAAVVVLADAVL